MKRFVIVLIIFFISLISVSPHIITGYWLTDALSNFKVQYAAFLIFLLAVSYGLRLPNWTKLLGIAAMIWNLWFIIPVFLGYEGNANPDPADIKLISINLLSSNLEIQKVTKFIGNTEADLIILQEYNDRWGVVLADALSDYAYSHTVPRSDNFGIAVFSKKEITAEEISPAGLPPTIRAIVREKGYTWTLYATHPFPPAGQQRFQIRNQQLHWLATEIRETGGPVIVAGDLNTSSFSPWFSELIAESGLKDSRHGFGILPTWPAGLWPVQTTLDHVLVSPEAMVTERTIGPDTGSDHLPVLASFRFRLVGE